MLGKGEIVKVQQESSSLRCLRKAFSTALSLFINNIDLAVYPCSSKAQGLFLQSICRPRRGLGYSEIWIRLDVYLAAGEAGAFAPERTFMLSTIFSRKPAMLQLHQERLEKSGLYSEILKSAHLADLETLATCR